jgi:lipopolysaccharide export system protein LptC
MWRRWVRGSLLIVSGILACFLVYLLATRTDSAPPPSLAHSGPLASADAGIDQFSFLQSQGGSVRWKVEAQRAHVLDAQHQAQLEQVRVTLYGATGEDLRLEGDSGTIDTASKNFTLVNEGRPIAVELSSGYTIYTNHLTWTDRTREIRTDDPVRMAGHGLEVRGRGLIAKLDTEEFKVLEDVQVDITP